MALVVKDRVREIGTANTTVSFSLSGAVTGFQTFAEIGNTNTTFYSAEDSAGNWEVGIGTYSTTGPTLTRTIILSSSNTGSAVTFSGGVTVFCTYPSEKSVNLNADGVMEVGQPIGYADTGVIATFATTEAGYNQIIVQNKSNASNASANINISNDVATDTTGFAELGINSSGFTGSGSFSIPEAAYLASSGTDLTIGTYSAHDVHIVTNSNTVDAMTIHDDGGIALGGLSDPGIGNIACNNINLRFQQVITSGGTTTLTNASPYYTQFTGTNTQDLVLPDATTCLVGTTFIFDNDSTQNVTIKDGAGTTFELLVPGGFHNFVLEDNSTIAGTWLRYSSVPSTAEWGTYSLSLGATTITGGIWNGGTIPTGYGGTGLTTFSGANNALYSTSASDLTAGTLPIAAGGTGATSFTAKSGNVAGLVFYDGTKLTNDATVTDVGYDTSTNTLKALNFEYTGTLTGSTGILNIGSGQIYKDSSGNVGIGITPTDKLTVNTTLASGTDQSGIRLYVSGTIYGALYGTGPSYSYAGVGANETWLYSGGRNLSIGSDGAYATKFVTNGAERARVSSAGGFSVGTTADPGAGAIYATGNITAYYSSDARLKENIKDVDNALDIVCAIGSKTFDWTDEYIASKGGEDGYFVQKSDFGVVAQDVQEVFPQAVRTREDGTLAVDYEKLATLSFGAIKSLLARVEALEAK